MVEIVRRIEVPERTRDTPELKEHIATIQRRSMRRQRNEIRQHLTGQEKRPGFFGVRNGAANLGDERGRKIGFGKPTKRIGDSRGSAGRWFVVSGGITRYLSGPLDLFREANQHL